MGNWNGGELPLFSSRYTVPRFLQVLLIQVFLLQKAKDHSVSVDTCKLQGHICSSSYWMKRAEKDKALCFRLPNALPKSNLSDYVQH